MNDSDLPEIRLPEQTSIQEDLVVPGWLVALKRGRVIPFTGSIEFPEVIEAIFQLVREQVELDGSRYSQDWVSVGLPGLANGSLRKSSRVFDLFVQDMPGKDKPEDELRDNMMISIYMYAYYRMLVEVDVDLEDESNSDGNGEEDEDEIRDNSFGEKGNKKDPILGYLG